jgi:hypothetical protein
MLAVVLVNKAYDALRDDPTQQGRGEGRRRVLKIDGFIGGRRCRLRVRRKAPTQLLFSSRKGRYARRNIFHDGSIISLTNSVLLSDFMTEKVYARGLVCWWMLNRYGCKSIVLAFRSCLFQIIHIDYTI